MTDWNTRIQAWRSRLEVRLRADMVTFKARMLAAKAPSEIVRVWFHKNVVPVEKICTTCSYVGAPTDEMPGRREIELTLWTLFFGIAILFVFVLLLGEIPVGPNFFTRLIHGTHRALKRVGELFAFLSLVYTIYRLSMQQEKCPKCQAATVIPLDSPRARELLKGR